MKNFLAALLVAFAAPALAAAPTEITAEFALSSSGVAIGRVKESFSRTAEGYTIRSVTSSEGVLKVFLDDQITMKSTGRVLPSGLQPLAFEQRRARDGKADVVAAFDWEHSVIRSQFKGEEKEIALPRATQDRLSLMYQFMNLELRPQVVFTMSNGRKVENYTYRLVGEERITTPAGEFDTVHYERVVANPKESRADVWLARDRFNFPVRVAYDDPKGLRIEQTLVALQSR